ncbi:MAG: hypothetical protein R3F14_19990 [Polyangiaceae bacterium]
MPDWVSLRCSLARWGSVLLLVAGGGCSPGREPVAWDTAGAEGRKALAGMELLKLSHARFEVLSFEAGAESTRVLEDDFHARSALYSVPFRARIRYLMDVEVAEMQELPARIGGEGWTPDRHREDVMSALVLGPGRHAAGTEQGLDALAVFEDTEPGYRLRAFDVKR